MLEATQPRDRTLDAETEAGVRKGPELPEIPVPVEGLEIEAVRPSLGWELVDTGVNAGTSRSARWLQESLNHFNLRGRLYTDLAVDGQVGLRTKRAFDALARKRGLRATCEVLRIAVDGKQQQHYALQFNITYH